MKWLTEEWARDYMENVLGEGAQCFVIPEDEGFDRVFDQAFSWFRGTEIVFPEGIVYIGREACANCSGLRHVTLPGTLKYIDDKAFYRCLRLRDVDFPEGLEGIGVGAFEDCYSLRRVSIPGSVKTVESRAFCHCRNLKCIRLHEGTEWLEYMAFGNNRSLFWFTRLHLPRSIIYAKIRGGIREDSIWEAFSGSSCAKPLRKRIPYWKNRKKGAEALNEGW